MSFADTLSAVVSLLGVVIALVTVAYALRWRRRGAGIRSLKSREDALGMLLDLEPKVMNVMGISLRGLLREYGDGRFRNFLESHPSTRVRVILLNPYSVASLKVVQRETMSLDLESFSQSYLFHDMLASVSLLNEMSQRIQNLEVRLYDSFPYGMLLLTEEYCLFEPYLAPESRQFSRQSVSLMIKKTSPEGGDLYNQMMTTFERVWTDSVPLSSDLAANSLKELAKLRNIIAHAGRRDAGNAQQ